MNRAVGLRVGWPVVGCLVMVLSATAEPDRGKPIDELVALLAGDPTLEVRKIDRLPADLQGPLLVIAEFDADTRRWLPAAKPEDYGRVTVDRIVVLGNEAGADGFVETRYLEKTDRRVVSYTGLTADRRMAVYLYDDAADKHALELQLRIGPHVMRYRVLRQAGPVEDQNGIE